MRLQTQVGSARRADRTLRNGEWERGTGNGERIRPLRVGATHREATEPSGASAEGMGNVSAPCGWARPIGRCACAEGVRLAETAGRAAKRTQGPTRPSRAERVPKEWAFHTSHTPFTPFKPFKPLTLFVGCSHQSAGMQVGSARRADRTLKCNHTLSLTICVEARCYRCYNHWDTRHPQETR